MPGTRTTFGRVDALLAVLELLGTAEGLADVKLADSELEPFQNDESVFAGDISGQIDQPVSAARRTRDQDEFTIPLHVCAERVAAQEDAIAARRRCEEMMNAIRETIATNAGVPSIPGLIDLVLTGADGPDPVRNPEPAGWVAYGTVRVRVRIRMS